MTPRDRHHPAYAEAVPIDLDHPLIPASILVVVALAASTYALTRPETETFRVPHHSSSPWQDVPDERNEFIRATCIIAGGETAGRKNAVEVPQKHTHIAGSRDRPVFGSRRAIGLGTAEGRRALDTAGERIVAEIERSNAFADETAR